MSGFELRVSDTDMHRPFLSFFVNDFCFMYRDRIVGIQGKSSILDTTNSLSRALLPVLRVESWI